jgi:dihydrofolate reductase
MGTVRLTITMSLDGYAAGLEQSADAPLGVGGDRLHQWFVVTRYFREAHGGEGGETGPDDDAARESFENVGATIMGRNMFGPVRGPWGDGQWRGWWGEDPPFHHPVFVLTHHAREPLEMQGGTTFHFITGGTEAALAQATAAAGGRVVHVTGGADVARQFLAAGLVDEMDIHVVPLLLGAGERLFEGTGGAQARFEPVRVVATPAAMHVRYRRAR